MTLSACAVFDHDRNRLHVCVIPHPKHYRLTNEQLRTETVERYRFATNDGLSSFLFVCTDVEVS